MAPLSISIATGTAAAMLAAILLLLRAEFHGRRPFVALTRRWIATSTRTSGLTLALLFGIAFACFASLSMSGSNQFRSTPVQSTALDPDDSEAGQALADLRAYADNIDTQAGSAAATSANSDSSELPDVDTMIAKLVARLKAQPGDVKGWKMLGWSYLNTGMLKEATKAYETALKLDPNDIEVKKGLERANSGVAGSIEMSAAEPAPQHVDTGGAAPDLPQDQGSMVRGMVDRLAARLETSPNDEAGWLLLMRSWMMLGETKSAKAAFAKAIATFSSDAAAQSRLTAGARELGVETD